MRGELSQRGVANLSREERIVDLVAILKRQQLGILDGILNKLPFGAIFIHQQC
jgi:hypothetical protein